ncbi:hydantoinase B/oxoprolinase family protein [Halobellus sp. GM3]|uniref:hydantoinase B/oxoprolinase family protein n=1 Tax=Halobellus sp. GM3 TaxID=3458410 RepID=UPI00403E08F0
MAAESDHDELNGIDKPYLPGEELDIADSIDLHTETADEVDPVTYRVLQHRIWNINQQHGETIENLSVSPVTLETRDFQTSIQDADGDFVYFGQYVQYFSGVMDLNVKWTLENRSENPGINPGDMFLTNDPWISAPHQQDVAVTAPVFYDGQLFCWVSNIAHQNDVGGAAPGSFVQHAEDIFQDPVPIPPVKIVAEGEIQRDIEESYRRHSRTPVDIGLNLRAQIAGNNHTREQILELVDEYGPETVKAVMHRITESSDQAFSDVLADIPDGTWEERAYQEVSETGDRGTYEMRLRMTKEGDTLRFDNEGTHPSEGVINLPLAGWRGSIMSAFNYLMIPEQMGAVGGIANHLEFEPEIGTLTSPEYGEPVSTSGMYAAHPAHGMAAAVISRMLLSSENEDLRRKAVSSIMSSGGMAMLAGVNQREDFFVGPLLDGVISAGAALPHRDGKFANGGESHPEAKAPNVEVTELDRPILFMYRGEQPDSAGVGTQRGGNGGKLGLIQHKGDVNIAGWNNEAIPSTHGLMGGGPPARLQTRVKRGTDVHAQFEQQELPDRFSAVEGETEHPEGKGEGMPLMEGDLFEFTWQSRAGYGDPIDRDPDKVAEDVRSERISDEVANDIYGVVLDGDSVDEAATEARRREIRDDRLEASTAAVDTADHAAGSTPIEEIRESDQYHIGDYLRVEDDRFECSKCGHDLGFVDENVKHELALRTRDIEDLGPLWIDPHVLVDDEMEFRDFYCPTCATRIATEIAKEGAEYYPHLRLNR